MNLDYWTAKLMRAPADEGTPGGDAPEGAGAPAEATTAGEEAAPDFSWMGEDHLSDGAPNWDAFREHYQGLSEQVSKIEPAADLPEAYDFAAPSDIDLKDFGLPEGTEFSIASDDPDFQPIFEELGGFMRESGLPQESATGLMGLLTKYKAAEMGKQIREGQAQYEKLGATDAAREARIERIGQAIDARLPKEDAAALKELTRSFGAVKALEALLKSGGQRTPTPSPAPPKPDPMRGRYPTNFSS